MVRILGSFAADGTELRLAELTARTGLHKSTLYRLLEAMRSYDLVGLDENTGRYHIGLRMFELGSLAIGRLGVERQAHPSLEKLVGLTGETAHLCVLDGGDAVCVAQVESRQTLRIPLGAGQRIPAYCTAAGKALLAFSEGAVLERYLADTALRPFTRRTVTKVAELRAQLRQAEQRGYAVDDQEREDGVRSIGAPVRDHLGKVVAAVSIAGPTLRITKDQIPELAVYVIEAASQISHKLGYGAHRTAPLGQAGTTTSRARRLRRQAVGA